MAIYLVKASSGERLVQADTKTGAIKHVMNSEVSAKVLSAVALANVIREKGLTIEQVNLAPKDEVQSDIEDGETAE